MVSDVVIGYHVDEFICPWSADLFCLITYLPWFHGQGDSTNPLPT